MRNTLGFFLIVTLALPFLGKMAFAIDFAINQNAIAAKYCKNKAKPELHCNGKCVLMQKLALADEEKENHAPAQLLVLDVAQFLHALYAWESPQMFTKKELSISPYTVKKIQPPIVFSHLQPPEFVA